MNYHFFEAGFLGQITPSPTGPSSDGKMGMNQVQLFRPNTCTQL